MTMFLIEKGSVLVNWKRFQQNYDVRDKKKIRRRCNKKNPEYLTTSMLHDTLYPDKSSYNDLFRVILFSSGCFMQFNLKLTTSEVKWLWIQPQEK